MVDLSRGIVDVLVLENGPDEVVRRVSDPHWFQAFCCVIGFDWHSSGTTTTGTGALKVAIDPERHGLVVAGGKGRTSRRTAVDIDAAAEALGLSGPGIDEFSRISRLSAKVDSACVQDGYHLYHHAMFVSETGAWSVVQQGMGERLARRYHWLSEGLESFVEEPHAGIACDRPTEGTLDMTSRVSREARGVSLDLVNDGPDHLRNLMRKAGPQPTLDDFRTGTVSPPHVSMPRRHAVLDIDISEKGWDVLRTAYELQPTSYEELVSIRGMGPQKVRALALVADVIYGAPSSWKDPVKYSFAHGGKDGYPYPVNDDVYQNSIRSLRDAVEAAKVGRRQRLGAIRRLSELL
jgi:hypothetical protein